MAWNFFKRDDPLAPRMPDVDVHPNIAELFAQVRSRLPRDRSMTEVKAGDPWLGIVCPDRTYLLLTLPVAAEMPQKLVEMNRSCIPHTRPLNITAVSFTGLRPSDEIRRMPFIAGVLLPFAYIGHRIVVFEGHESGFAPALEDADVLVVDSGMLPFLQHDWYEVARRAFRDKGRIRMFDRNTSRLSPVVPSKTPAGWAYATEPDGERSYVNSLLTTLARRTPISVQLEADARLPELPKLATSPEEIEWTTALPFDYGALSVEEVIRITSSIPGIRWLPTQEGQTTGDARVKLAEGKGLARDVYFRFLLTDGGPRGRSLKIERLDERPAG